MFRPLFAPIAFLSIACSSEIPPGHEPSTLTRTDTKNWSYVRKAFSTLSTIAGKGASDAGNEWQPRFENGLAVAAELSRPHFAQADAAGNVYVADKESHGIRRIAPDGTIATFAGINLAGNAPNVAAPAIAGALANPNGLWVSPNGNVYIVDLDNKKIRRVTPDGMMSTFITLTTLTTGRGLWVADDESEAYVASGTTLLQWTPAKGTQPLAAGFGELGMVVKTADGRVLVGDRGSRRVYAVSVDGQKTVVAGDGSAGNFVDGGQATETSFDEPRAIWPFGGGLLVGLHNGCKIIYVDNEGYAHLMLDGTSKSHGGDGLPYDPTKLLIGEVRSITVNSQGDLIFVENDRGYVRKVKGVP
jgi:serine/threonine-protein kinase